MISGIVNMVGFSMLNDRINEDRKRNEERREEEKKNFGREEE